MRPAPTWCSTGLSMTGSCRPRYAYQGFTAMVPGLLLVGLMALAVGCRTGPAMNAWELRAAVEWGGHGAQAFGL